MKIIEPIGQRILVRKHHAEADEVKRMERAGLHIPDIVKARRTPPATVGTVIARSPQLDASIPIHPGDIVFFNRWSGSECIVETESFLVLELAEIIGVLREIADPPKEHLAPPEWLAGEERSTS